MTAQGDDGAGERDGAALARVEPQVVTLSSGRRIEASRDEGGADLLQIRARDGRCVLSVRVTDEGPVLSFSGAALEIAATRTLDLSCEELRLHATGGATIDVGGSLTANARSMALEAKPGGIVVKANDDLDLKGERVLLNSDDPPMPLTMEEYRARLLAGAEAGPSSSRGDLDLRRQDGPPVDAAQEVEEGERRFHRDPLPPQRR